MKYFIKTSDIDTANKLKSAGLPEMGKEGKFYVFANVGNKLNFTEDEKKKIVYSNVCCV